MTTVNLGFENQLWKMADKLRGNIESSVNNYVDVVNKIIMKLTRELIILKK